ncbi:hypothetical protein AYO21_09403 [Fonsecaea monophora]|uniref:Uncharacterized protein n=1 Tax=Fonsecaea monophora TaxID=254056 RepID=A0A177EWT5_9EURO|nr:hypothetical protein AYO21_09403 [Fonsecaea monophora]OAG36418.1 hypothetical protein AYO21_09403 [Fonsecaea monophora]
MKRLLGGSTAAKRQTLVPSAHLVPVHKKDGDRARKKEILWSPHYINEARTHYSGGPGIKLRPKFNDPWQPTPASAPDAKLMASRDFGELESHRRRRYTGLYTAGTGRYSARLNYIEEVQDMSPDDFLAKSPDDYRIPVTPDDYRIPVTNDTVSERAPSVMSEPLSQNNSNDVLSEGFGMFRMDSLDNHRSIALEAGRGVNGRRHILTDCKYTISQDLTDGHASALALLYALAERKPTRKRPPESKKFGLQGLSQRQVSMLPGSQSE